MRFKDGYNVDNPSVILNILLLTSRANFKGILDSSYTLSTIQKQDVTTTINRSFIIHSGKRLLYSTAIALYCILSEITKSILETFFPVDVVLTL